MESPRNSAVEGLLSSAERWSPAESELWSAWRETLSEAQRSEVLFPLQALLSGIVAHRQEQSEQAGRRETDYRAQLRAVYAGYSWALQLAERLLDVDSADAPLGSASAASATPAASLVAIEQSLRDALRLSERLLDLPLVDLGAFEASTDFFLRELERNVFFNPPEPLEFSNVDDLVRSDVIAKDLDFWKSGAATMVALLTLLRAHRFLGISERQRATIDGTKRAETVLAGIRRELRALRLFLSLQGLDHVAAELAGLDLRSGDEARAQLKAAAKTLRGGPQSERPGRRSERVARSPHQDIWAFRFILRAFMAKALAISGEAEDRSFAREFVGHFRRFGPKLMRATEYPHSRQLTAAVSALNRRAGADRQAILIAASECERFVVHLDAALHAPAFAQTRFDKQEAAEELRGYLEDAKARFTNRRAAAAAFGLVDPNAQAS
jgi:hypothetical protein